jgi:hypothetical protein
MTKHSSLPYAALLVTLLVLGATFGGAAEAKAKVIGKNLVVSKSIKNGAVTGPKLAADAVDGSKVRNGSLTAADLAPGTIPTIPAPTNGKAAVFAGTSSLTGTGDASQLFTAFGSYVPPSAYGAYAPVALEVADLHVLTAPQDTGKTLTVTLYRNNVTFSAAEALLTCTVSAGTTCQSAQTGVIPAGATFYFVAQNGAIGNGSGYAAVSYTMKAQ